MAELLGSPLTLPCGAVLKNRMVKAAMTECLADPTTSLPNRKHFTLYEVWSKGGAAMSITGNVMVDRRYKEASGNVALEAEDRKHLDLYQKYASSAKAGGAVALVQLSHSGRQTPRAVSWEPIAPSPVRLRPGGVPSFITPQPREMTEADIQDVIERFVTSAKLCQEAGFDGVQLHSAHGYLLSQFLSPRTNQRTDGWGGSLQNRMKLLVTIASRIREAVGASFVVGIKLNSSDFQRGGFDEDDSLQVLSALAKLKVDFVEISGGNYEQPKLVENVPAASTLQTQATTQTQTQGSTDKKEFKAESTKQREAYFLEFAEKARKHVPGLVLMVTGGFRTKQGMEAALATGSLDLIGLARPLCLQPALPLMLLNGLTDKCIDYDIGLPAWLHKSQPGLASTMNAAIQNFWHQKHIDKIAHLHLDEPHDADSETKTERDAKAATAPAQTPTSADSKDKDKSRNAITHANRLALKHTGNPNMSRFFGLIGWFVRGYLFDIRYYPRVRALWKRLRAVLLLLFIVAVWRL